MTGSLEGELAKLGPNAADRVARVNGALRQSLSVDDYAKVNADTTTAEKFESLEKRLAAEGKLSREASEEITLRNLYPTMTKGR